MNKLDALFKLMEFYRLWVLYRTVDEIPRDSTFEDEFLKKFPEQIILILGKKWDETSAREFIRQALLELRYSPTATQL